MKGVVLFVVFCRRDRFWQNKAVWGRIRGGNRLAKELGEIVPVLAFVIKNISSLNLKKFGGKKVVIVDLCSGFGYLAMFLSCLLPADKVDKIVCVDKMWSPHNVERKPHHLSTEHILADGWPIRLTTSRTDLKVPSDRRNLARTFFADGAPVMLLGVHLCGVLSLRAVQLFNESPCIVALALKPCCLPPKIHAKRCEVFELGDHKFSAAHVCVEGRWRGGKWVGPESREVVERRFHIWAENLARGVDVGKGKSSLETIVVQKSWFQNSFIFSQRPFSPSLPYGSLAARDTKESPEDDEKDMSTKKERKEAAAAERVRLAAAYKTQQLEDKFARRRERWTAQQTAAADLKWADDPATAGLVPPGQKTLDEKEAETSELRNRSGGCCGGGECAIM